MPNTSASTTSLPTFDSLLISSLLRMAILCCSPIALLLITTKGVLISFSKYVCIMVPDTSQSLKSSVGNLDCSKSSGASVVNCRSSLTEFMASLHTLAILTLLVSPSASSSSFHSLLNTNASFSFTYLIPLLNVVPECLPSST